MGIMDNIDKIKRLRKQAIALLTENRKALLGNKARLKTPKQKAAYERLAQKFNALNKTFKDIQGRIQQLNNMLKAAKAAAAKIKQLGARAKQAVMSRARGLIDRLRRRRTSLRDLPEIEDIGYIHKIDNVDDLGVAPVVIAAGAAALVASILMGLGALINQLNTLRDENEALQEQLDTYEEEAAQRKEEPEREREEEPEPDEEEF